jgi:hypothetical protein
LNKIVEMISSEREVLGVKGHEMRAEVLEMATGCLWGVVKLCSGEIVRHLLESSCLSARRIVQRADGQSVQENQVKLLIDVLPSLRTDTARARVIDTLALLASRPNVSNEENKVCLPALLCRIRTKQLILQAIGDFLLSSFSAPPPAALSPELLVSVLNAIIDIHADEDRSYDLNFTQDGHLQALSSQVNRVRNEVSHPIPGRGSTEGEC